MSFQKVLFLKVVFRDEVEPLKNGLSLKKVGFLRGYVSLSSFKEL